MDVKKELGRMINERILLKISGMCNEELILMFGAFNEPLKLPFNFFNNGEKITKDIDPNSIIIDTRRNKHLEIKMSILFDTKIKDGDVFRLTNDTNKKLPKELYLKFYGMRMIISTDII